MKRSLFAIGTSLVLLFALVAPGSANPEKAGVAAIFGTVTVGKTISNWTNSGCDSVAGPGLGFPIISQAKNAYFHLQADKSLVNVTGLHAGSMNLCGRLGPTLDNTVWIPGNIKKGIGASCGISKGYDGKGVFTVPSPSTKAGDHWLTDVGWKIDASGFLLVTGKIHTGPAKSKTPTDGVIGIIRVSGGQECITKRDNPKLGLLHTGPKVTGQGATSFSVSGIIAVVPTGAFLGNRNDFPSSPKGSNDMPLFCKKGKKDGGPCLYQSKK